MSRAMALAAALCLAALPARAAFIATALETSAGVVITGAGTLNLDGLTRLDFDFASSLASVFPGEGVLALGPAGGIQNDVYAGASGPAFGGNVLTLATSGTGSRVGPSFGDRIVVPLGYESGAPLTASSTFAGATFADLGMQPGVHVWSWEGDSFTLVVGPTAFVATAVETSDGVVISGSGRLNLTGLTRLNFDFASSLAAVFPALGLVAIGPAGQTSNDVYAGASGPLFGGPFLTLASSGSGSRVGVNTASDGQLSVPVGYLSGDLLSASSTFGGASFASLGMEPGTHVWSWEGGTFTLQVGPVAVPGPAALPVFALALAGLILVRRRRRGAAQA